MSELDNNVKFLKKLKGTGTKEDQIIIENLNDFFYYDSQIEESNWFVQLINCDFSDLEISLLL